MVAPEDAAAVMAAMEQAFQAPQVGAIRRLLTDDSYVMSEASRNREAAMLAMTIAIDVSRKSEDGLSAEYLAIIAGVLCVRGRKG